MNVSIVGPGALGCLFAARLCNVGVSTTLVDYKKDRATRLVKSGILVDTDTEQISAKPNVQTSVPTGQDLVIILTKAHATKDLKLPTGVPVLTLQNGLGNVETLCELVGSANILAGTTSEAATYLEEGRVRHAGSGVTRIGSWTSCDADDAVSVLAQAGFETELTDAPGQIIWEKVAISAGINTVTALLDVPNGRIHELPEPRKLIRNLVVEAAKVAAMEGYRFEYSLVELAERVCIDSATNISSMLQDVRAGRQTEIEAISGEILRRGDLASLPAPRTRVVYQLIRGLEQR